MCARAFLTLPASCAHTQRKEIGEVVKQITSTPSPSKTTELLSSLEEAVRGFASFYKHHTDEEEKVLFHGYIGTVAHFFASGPCDAELLSFVRSFLARYLSALRLCACW